MRLTTERAGYTERERAFFRVFPLLEASCEIEVWHLVTGPMPGSHITHGSKFTMAILRSRFLTDINELMATDHDMHNQLLFHEVIVELVNLAGRLLANCYLGHFGRSLDLGGLTSGNANVRRVMEVTGLRLRAFRGAESPIGDARFVHDDAHPEDHSGIAITLPGHLNFEALLRLNLMAVRCTSSQKTEDLPVRVATIPVRF